MLHQEAQVDDPIIVDNTVDTFIQVEWVKYFDKDINILVEDECNLEDLAKYEVINKILEEVDMPYPYWSKEDNKIKSRFLHSVNEIEIKNMSIT